MLHRFKTSGEATKDGQIFFLGLVRYIVAEATRVQKFALGSPLQRRELIYARLKK